VLAEKKADSTLRAQPNTLLPGFVFESISILQIPHGVCAKFIIYLYNCPQRLSLGRQSAWRLWGSAGTWFLFQYSLIPFQKLVNPK
jgi:hypothetical protein